MIALSVSVLGFRVFHVEMELRGRQAQAEPQQQGSSSNHAGQFDVASGPEPSELHVGFR